MGRALAPGPTVRGLGQVTSALAPSSVIELGLPACKVGLRISSHGSLTIILKHLEFSENSELSIYSADTEYSLPCARPI